MVLLDLITIYFVGLILFTFFGFMIPSGYNKFREWWDKKPNPDSSCIFEVRSHVDVESNKFSHVIYYTKNGKNWHKINKEYESEEDAKEDVFRIVTNNHVAFTWVPGTSTLPEHTESKED